jgi:hypothetical protein
MTIKTLVMILNTNFKKQIALYCLISLASLVSVICIIIP